MFYDRFEELCKEKGVKPGRACTEMGVSRSLAAKWKATGTENPSADALKKMSIYFGKSIEEILSGKTKKAPTGDGERIPHRDKRELLAGRGVSLLLDADAKLTDEQLDDIVNFIQFQQEKNGR